MFQLSHLRSTNAADLKGYMRYRPVYEGTKNLVVCGAKAVTLRRRSLWTWG